MPQDDEGWAWPFRELGWSLVFIVTGLLLVAYPFAVFFNLRGWGGALVALVSGGLGLLAGLVLLISGGAGLVRSLRRSNPGSRG
jgi:hypothetical protein